MHYFVSHSKVLMIKPASKRVKLWSISRSVDLTTILFKQKLQLHILTGLKSSSGYSNHIYLGKPEKSLFDQMVNQGWLHWGLGHDPQICHKHYWTVFHVNMLMFVRKEPRDPILVVM